jgi:hypothetical protein
MRRPGRPHRPEAGPIADGATSHDGPGEAFIPGGSPYLGQAILGEPIHHINVLLPDRRVS